MPYANKADNKKWYQANRDRLIIKARLWELANPALAAQKKREYLKRHPARRKATVAKSDARPEAKLAKVLRRKESPEMRLKEKGYRDKYKNTLHDAYVRRVMAGKMKIKGSELPQSLVDAQRELMKLKRSINEKL